ncbi:MAG: hypothetical protein ACJ736_21165 [Streptomyces sp.]
MQEFGDGTARGLLGARTGTGVRTGGRKERTSIRSEKGIRWGERPRPPQPERPGELLRSQH